MREKILTLVADSRSDDPFFIAELFFPAPFRKPAVLFELHSHESDPFRGLREHGETPPVSRERKGFIDRQEREPENRYFPYRVKFEIQ